MEELKVCKFGGSSITTPQDIAKIKQIVKDDPSRRIIVVSAPGKKNPGDTKVTDMLINLATVRDQAPIPSIIQRFRDLHPKIADELERDLRQRAGGPITDPKAYQDSLASFGEEANARLISGALDFCYVDPEQLFKVTPDFQKARMLPGSAELTNRVLTKLLRKPNEILVIPGFYGHTEDGQRATFGRGMSDFTGAFVAAAVNASLYENFTDQDGVLSANPNVVANPSIIDRITYGEMRDLAYTEFGILHSEAINPVIQAMIPIHIRNTAEYPREGTLIVDDRIHDINRPIVGIAYGKDFCSFDISGPELNGNLGILADALNVFRQKGVSVEHVPSGIDDFSVIVNQNDLYSANQTSDQIGSIKRALYETIKSSGNQDFRRNGGRVDFKDNLGCLVVAGKGIKRKRELSSEVERELATHGIDVVFSTKGTQQRSIIYGVNMAQGNKAVNALYDKYLR